MEKDFGKLYNEIITQFLKTQSVNKTVEATGASEVTVQKALITEGLCIVFIIITIIGTKTQLIFP